MTTSHAPQAYEPSPHGAFRKKKGPDSAALGLLAGIVFPVLGILVLYFFWGSGSFPKYIQMFFDTNNPFRMDKASKVVSLSLIANLIPFYYFLNRKSYQTTKGIILASFLYCLLIVMYKFIWQ
jgi:amino acid permease